MAQVATAQGIELPAVRTLSISDLTDVLSLGIRDFKYFWYNSVFLLAIVIPLAAWIIDIVVYDNRFLHLIFPLVSGLSLVAPVAAIVFYQQSRWREQAGRGADGRRHVYSIGAKAMARIFTLAVLLFGVLASWLLVADGLYQACFDGDVALKPSEFWHQVFYTQAGADMAIIGTVLGLFFAILVFCFSVTSFPLLIDRDVGVPVAVATSIRVVATNPKVMAYWAVFIAGALFLASLPLLLGLTVVLPVLGHASWHLYRRAVGNDMHGVIPAVSLSSK